ncbi:MAG: HAD family hydrolase [Candidatus Binatia bacterium]
MPGRAVIFDLDGTLLDSLGDIADSMNAALLEMGFSGHEIKSYRLFVGDGVAKLARRALPEQFRGDDTVEECMRRMRRIYAGRLCRNTRPYPGIEDMLDALISRGIRMAVLSNKPDEFTRILVSRLLNPRYFACVFGARPELSPKPDPRGLLAVAGALGLEPARCVYVGDSGVDMRTASAAGMRSVGVLWGFRGEAELRQAGADAIIATPEDLPRLV